MAYIGNGRTLLVLGSNVRDDINPDGTNLTFPLSQEVPGGYEGNVYVFKQTYLFERLISSAASGSIQIRNVTSTTFEIYSSDDAISSALSSIRESLQNFTESVHTLTISTYPGVRFPIQSCVYNGTEITITLSIIGTVTADNTSQFTLTHGYYGFWEILDPEYDYTIGPDSGVNQNKEITFSKLPKVLDRIYVIHKGDATYNLVPSDNSVGPDQLSQNLRDFSKQSITAPASTTTYTLNQNAINNKAILVTVDGLVQEGEDYNGVSVSANSDYALNVSNSPNEIIFRVAPSTGAKIRILHLGFSTVSRKAVLSPGQVGSVGNDSIGTAQLQNNSVSSDKLQNSSVISSKINDSAVLNSKIADNAITSNKLLLVNNTAIRSYLSNGSTVQNLLSVGTDEVTNVTGSSQVSINIASSKTTNITASSIAPETTSVQSLGTSSKKFSDLHLSGAANVASISATGNISVSGTVDGVDISSFETSVNASLSTLNSLVDLIVPIGTVVPYSGALASATLLNNKWMICDGAPISRTTYSALWNIFGTTSSPYGQGDGTSTFNLPDLRRRVPVGLGTFSSLGNTDGLAETSRSITHSHTVPAHQHGLANHTHNLPGHFHQMNTSLGSSLNIVNTNGTNADKGGHTTTIDIGHTHTGFSTDNSDGLTTGADTGAGAPPHNTGGSVLPASRNWLSLTEASTNGNLGHRHGGVTGGMSANTNHSHTVSVTGAHTHTVNTATTTKRTDNTGGFDVRETGTSNTNSAGAHSHTLDDANLAHTHSIAYDKTYLTLNHHQHTHAIPDHSHPIPSFTLAATSRSDSDANRGIHTHSASNFSGSIGNVNGAINGNITGGTNVSQGPSTNISDSSSELTSGSATNSPYILLNYIIRVI